MENEPPAIVWARNGVMAMSCPRSMASADSLTWIDEYHIWRMTGRKDLLKMPARKAEALLTLETEWTKEKQHGEQ